jgi:putative hydrolase of the HAD superfamily
MTDLCVVFDIDDTLYLERDYVWSGFDAAGSWASRWLGRSDFAERCRAAHENGQRGQIFNSVLADCGIPARPELISTLLSIYRTHVPSIGLCADAAAALAIIAESCPIAVISDGPAISQSRKAEALGLARFASPVLLTELFGRECSKPSPVAFREVERMIPADRFVYIADNPLKDFTAPATLGWRTIRIRRPGGLHFKLESTVVTPDFELPDCTEVPRIVSRIVSEERRSGGVALSADSFALHNG